MWSTADLARGDEGRSAGKGAARQSHRPGGGGGGTTPSTGYLEGGAGGALPQLQMTTAANLTVRAAFRAGAGEG